MTLLLNILELVLLLLMLMHFSQPLYNLKLQVVIHGLIEVLVNPQWMFLLMFQPILDREEQLCLVFQDGMEILIETKDILLDH